MTDAFFLQDKHRVNLFLIDGFPRNADNLEGWDKIVGDSVPHQCRHH